MTESCLGSIMHISKPILTPFIYYDVCKIYVDVPTAIVLVSNNICTILLLSISYFLKQCPSSRLKVIDSLSIYRNFYLTNLSMYPLFSCPVDMEAMNSTKTRTVRYHVTTITCQSSLRNGGRMTGITINSWMMTGRNWKE